MATAEHRLHQSCIDRVDCCRNKYRESIFRVHRGGNTAATDICSFDPRRTAFIDPVASWRRRQRHHRSHGPPTTRLLTHSVVHIRADIVFRTQPAVIYVPVSGRSVWPQPPS